MLLMYDNELPYMLLIVSVTNKICCYLCYYVTIYVVYVDDNNRKLLNML